MSSIRLLSKIGPLLHTRCRDCPFMLFDSASYSQASLAASATLPDSRSTLSILAAPYPSWRQSDANTPDNRGKTPVLMAAFLGYIDTVRALVHECSEDVKIQNLMAKRLFAWLPMGTRRR